MRGKKYNHLRLYFLLNVVRYADYFFFSNSLAKSAAAIILFFLSPSASSWRILPTPYADCFILPTPPIWADFIAPTPFIIALLYYNPRKLFGVEFDFSSLVANGELDFGTQRLNIETF